MIRWNQREGINYKRKFSPIFAKDSFCFDMALLVQFVLEIHKIDIKITS